MVTRGIIRGVPSGEVTIIDGVKTVDNKFKVEIPSLRTANNVTTTSINAFLTEALLCYQPGNLNSYRVDDVVFLSIGEPESLPIIIGKMYIGDEEATNYSKDNTLEVVQKAILPEDTTIGELTYKDILCSLKEADNGDNVYATQSEVTELSEDIGDINERLDELGFDSATANIDWVFDYGSGYNLPLAWRRDPELCCYISGGITKEGNFANLKLYFEIYHLGSVTSGSTKYGYKVQVPTRFKPKTTQVIDITTTGSTEQFIINTDGVVDAQIYTPNVTGEAIYAGVRLNVDLYYRLN